MALNFTTRTIIYIIFGLSGFCALVYEILWTKYLSLTFGTTMIAISIVAATFMAGLAIGSYLLGKYSDRETNLLRTYAYLEIGIALLALLFPPLLELATALHTSIERLFPELSIAGHLTHFLFSTMLLLPPTAFMGGTFPLMCRLFAREKSKHHVGFLYFINTLGATIGAFSSGYVLIPRLGLSTTGYLAAFLNVAVASAAFWLARQTKAPQIRINPKSQTTISTPISTHNRPVLLAIALVGFLSLAYEILWTRVFLLFLGNTSYAFSMILGSFLMSLAIGGALYTFLARARMNDRTIFSTFSGLMGITILMMAPFYDRLAHIFQFIHQTSGERWWLLTGLSFLIVMAVVSLPTVFSGCLLPAAVAILNPGKDHTGEGVGLVVLNNTLGAVLGSLVASFLLIPRLGILNSFFALAILNILIGVTLYSPTAKTNHRPRIITAALTIIFVWISLPMTWDPGLMNSGIYFYAPKYARMGGLRHVIDQEKILESIEGIDASVAVHEGLDGNARFFTVNGKTDGGTGADMTTQVLVGHVPMLLHPYPQEVLVIGLGTGITLKGLSGHPTHHIHCAEISPEVVQASKYFTEANGNVLRDPKVSLSIEDGRNLLLTWPKKYDVIISEPSNPWQSGNANLFTAEFYRLAASRLKDDGLFCQWIGTYDITENNLRIAMRTLLDTFPRTMVFRVGSDLLIVGGQNELRFDYRALKERLSTPGVAETLTPVGITSPGALIGMHYLYSESSLMNFSHGVPLNTDDHPVLEYSARHLLGEKTLGELQTKNMTALKKVAGNAHLPIANLGGSKEDVARALRDIARGFARGGNHRAAEHFMRKAAEFSKPDRRTAALPF